MDQERLVLILFISSLHGSILNSNGASACPQLEPLVFGQLLLSNGTDVSCNQPQYNPDDTIQYTCASGYMLVNVTDNTTLSQTTATCSETTGEWSLVGVACKIIECTNPPLISNGVVSVTGTSYPVGTSVYYQCNVGYRIAQTSGTIIIITASNVVSVCNRVGNWHVIPTCVAENNSRLSDYDVLVIILATVAGICSISICLNMCSSIWALKLRIAMTKGDMAEDEVAYVRSPGAFTLNNPLMVAKDDESTGNPLYLTPEEMDEFENKKKPGPPKLTDI